MFDNSLPIRTRLLKASEVLLIVLALPLTYKVHGGEALMRISGMDATAGLIGLLVLLCLYFVDFYEPDITVHRIHSLSRIMQATGLTLLIVGPLLEIKVPVLTDTASMLLGLILVAVGLTTSRFVFAQVVSNPSFAEPAIVWGSGPLAACLVRELQNRPDLGIQVVGIVDRCLSGKTFAGVRYLGPPDLLWSFGDSGQVSKLILALDEGCGSLPLERLMAAKTNGLNIENGTELYEKLTGRVWLDTFSVANLLFSRKLRPSAAVLLFKRILSLSVAAIALVVSLPIMLFTALLIRCESAGPVIFRQTRIGKNGHPFTMFKFRSMKVNAVGCAPAMRDDPRCTRVGNWIRRFRIDELPQLMNILKGDMDLVGPRPFVPEQEASLVREIPDYRQRWTVPPGVTGWAQVHRGYCSSLEDNIEKLSYDLFYIKNLSLALDILVLFKTLRVVLFGRGGR